MSTYATAFALATAYALVVAAMRHARNNERKAQLQRRDCALRVSAAIRAMDESKAVIAVLQTAVEQREQAIAGLLGRLNASNVYAVAARRAPVLGLPVHRGDPRQFSRN